VAVHGLTIFVCK